MVDEKQQQLITALRAEGRPVTPQRMRVWEALHATPGTHLTAAELHCDCPELPLATVYNTLELFSDLGLIVPLALPDVVRYDADPTPHINVICTGCGSVADVEISLADTVQAHVAATSGYQLHYPRMDWYGLCPSCRGGGV